MADLLSYPDDSDKAARRAARPSRRWRADTADGYRLLVTRMLAGAPPRAVAGYVPFAAQHWLDAAAALCREIGRRPVFIRAEAQLGEALLMLRSRMDAVAFELCDVAALALPADPAAAAEALIARARDAARSAPRTVVTSNPAPETGWVAELFHRGGVAPAAALTAGLVSDNLAWPPVPAAARHLGRDRAAGPGLEQTRTHDTHKPSSAPGAKCARMLARGGGAVKRIFARWLTRARAGGREGGAT